MRNEFWETRVEGKEEIWRILRNAIETDEGIKYKIYIIIETTKMML